MPVDYKFDAKAEARHIQRWIKNQIAARAPGGKVVLGISGGKDSTIAAALAARAIGPENVLGILMPDGIQSDIDYAKRAVHALDIQSRLVNIQTATESIQTMLLNAKDIDTNKYRAIEPSRNAKINTPPRIRTATLYAIAASLDVPGLVCCNSNLSETYIGYTTKGGDNMGDIAPLREYTVSELKAIGDIIGLPYELVHKKPSDGLSGITDEQKTGIPYDILDKYLRTGVCDDAAILARIQQAHALAEHKVKRIPSCKPRAVTAA